MGAVACARQGDCAEPCCAVLRCAVLCHAVLRSVQSYEEQRQAAAVRLADLQQQFEAAVAGILGLTPGQQPHLLAAALQEQQQLQEAQVRGFCVAHV